MRKLLEWLWIIQRAKGETHLNGRNKMRKAAKIFVLISIYSLSAWHNWNWVNRAFSKGGIYSKITPGALEVAFTYCPLINTLAVVSLELISPTISIPWNEHFNITK